MNRGGACVPQWTPGKYFIANIFLSFLSIEEQIQIQLMCGKHCKQMLTGPKKKAYSQSWNHKRPGNN